MEEQDRLKEINEKREKVEFEYNRFKKMLAETSEHNEYKVNHIRKMMDSESAKCDPALMQIYEERLNSIKSFQEKQAEYLDEYEKEWHKMNEEMDSEENELKKAIEEKEENSSQEEEKTD